MTDKIIQSPAMGLPGKTGPDNGRPAVIYAVCASKGHDNEGHYECGKRMTSILDALASHGLTPNKQPHEVKMCS
jgi:hypothetical protein